MSFEDIRRSNLAFALNNYDGTDNPELVNLQRRITRHNNHKQKYGLVQQDIQNAQDAQYTQYSQDIKDDFKPRPLIPLTPPTMTRLAQNSQSRENKRVSNKRSSPFTTPLPKVPRNSRYSSGGPSGSPFNGPSDGSPGIDKERVTRTLLPGSPNTSLSGSLNSLLARGSPISTPRAGLQLAPSLSLSTPRPRANSAPESPEDDRPISSRNLLRGSRSNSLRGSPFSTPRLQLAPLENAENELLRGSRNTSFAGSSNNDLLRGSRNTSFTRSPGESPILQLTPSLNNRRDSFADRAFSRQLNLGSPATLRYSGDLRDSGRGFDLSINPDQPLIQPERRKIITDADYMALRERLLAEQPDLVKCSQTDSDENPLECTKVRDQATENCPLDKAAHSQQGEVFIGCPNERSILKHSTARRYASIHKDNTEPHDLYLFEQACKTHEALAKTFSTDSTNVVERSVALNLIPLAEGDNNCYYCLCGVNDVALELSQERVYGITLGKWLKKMMDEDEEEDQDENGDEERAEIKKRHEDRRDLILSPGAAIELFRAEFGEDVAVATLDVLLQAIGFIYGIYIVPIQKGLLPFYHNDTHTDNFMVVEAKDDEKPTLTYQVGKLFYTLPNQRYITKAIDYGTMTIGYKLNTSYRPEISTSPPSPPFLDICHLLGSLSENFRFNNFLSNLVPFKDRPCGPLGSSSRASVNFKEDATISTVENYVTSLLKARKDLLEKL